MKTLAHLMKLALIAALIFGCWKLYTATEEAKLASAPSNTSARSTAYLSPSTLTRLDTTLLETKFLDADRAWARANYSTKAKNFTAESLRYATTTASEIPGLNPSPSDPTTPVVIYAHSFSCCDAAGRRETFISAFAITETDDWTYYSPDSFRALESTIRAALTPLAIVP